MAYLHDTEITGTFKLKPDGINSYNGKETGYYKIPVGKIGGIELNAKLPLFNTTSDTDTNKLGDSDYYSVSIRKFADTDDPILCVPANSKTSAEISTGSTQGYLSVNGVPTSVKGLTSNDTPTFTGLKVSGSSGLTVESTATFKNGFEVTRGIVSTQSFVAYGPCTIHNSLELTSTLTIKHPQYGDTGSSSFAAIQANGCIHAHSFNSLSDARVKENFRSLDCGDILTLPVYTFDFINGSKNEIGCKAQDLQKICPEIVHTNEDGILSIQESKIVYLLLEEMKKLKKEIDNLKGDNQWEK